ncbi:MAG: hypothetical protein IT503_14365 [Burkholderiaceae bacterium]|nr:MAG: hypothetical protein F9K36_18115 [Burkholderiaceae bacterium]MCC7287358.1 hypothetical protein [Burkholderiaceae bacterium]
MSTTSEADAALHSLFDAAAIWLQRIGADETDHVVARVFPEPGLGTWRQDWPHVKYLGAVGDAEAEVLAPLARVLTHALEQLQEQPRQALGRALAAGARLRALISPATNSVCIEALNTSARVEIALLAFDEPAALH